MRSFNKGIDELHAVGFGTMLAEPGGRALHAAELVAVVHVEVAGVVKPRGQQQCFGIGGVETGGGGQGAAFFHHGLGMAQRVVSKLGAQLFVEQFGYIGLGLFYQRRSSGLGRFAVFGGGLLGPGFRRFGRVVSGVFRVFFSRFRWVIRRFCSGSDDGFRGNFFHDMLSYGRFIRRARRLSTRSIGCKLKTAV